MISVEEFDITLLPHSIYFCIFYTVIHFQRVNSKQRKLSQCGIGKCKRCFRTEFNCTLFYAVPPSLDLSFSLSRAPQSSVNIRSRFFLHRHSASSLIGAHSKTIPNPALWPFTYVPRTISKPLLNQRIL